MPTVIIAGYKCDGIAEAQIYATWQEVAEAFLTDPTVPEEHRWGWFPPGDEEYHLEQMGVEFTEEQWPK